MELYTQTDRQAGRQAGRQQPRKTSQNTICHKQDSDDGKYDESSGGVHKGEGRREVATHSRVMGSNSMGSNSMTCLTGISQAGWCAKGEERF